MAPSILQLHSALYIAWYFLFNMLPKLATWYSFQTRVFLLATQGDFLMVRTKKIPINLLLQVKKFLLLISKSSTIHGSWKHVIFYFFIWVTHGEFFTIFFVSSNKMLSTSNTFIGISIFSSHDQHFMCYFFV